MQDIAWVESHGLEYPELRIELQPQRFYPHGTMLAHVLGYVGEISPKQLEQEEYSSRGLRPGDIIVADEDGVVVVPQERAEEVLKKAQEIDQRESGMFPFIRQFKSLSKAIEKFNRI